MENIVGPFGTGVNETTDRPEDPDPTGSTDTWFQPCVGGAAGTGTKVTAVWLNKVTALLRSAIRGMGVTDDATDDDMLLKAIQKLNRGIESKGVAGAVDVQAGINPANGNYIIRKIRGSGITVAIDPTNGELVLTVGGDSVSLTGLAPVMLVEQRRANLVSGGVLAQNAWTTRPLTNIVTGAGQIPSAALVSNRIQLPAGSYRAQFMGNASKAGHHRTRLMDVTNNVMLGLGNSADSWISTGNSTLNVSIGVAHFTLAGDTLIELQTYASNNGQGGVSHMGDGEDSDIGSGNYHVDGWVEIIKEA